MSHVGERGATAATLAQAGSAANEADWRRGQIRPWPRPRPVVQAALAGLLGLLGAAAPVQAQLGLTAGVSVGGTNNATSAAEIEGMEGAEGSAAEADAFTRTSLGARYLLRTPRSTHTFTYTLGAYFYVASGQSVSFNNEITWTGAITPTAFSELALTLGASQGRTNDLDLFNRNPVGVEAVERPIGAETFVSASAGQSFSYQFNPDWSMGQNLNGSIFQPVSEGSQQARTMGADAGLTLNRTFIQNAASLFVRAGHGRSEAVVVEGVELFPKRRADYGEAGLGYTLVFNEDWNTYLGAGVLAVRVPQIRDPFLDMSVHGTVNYYTPTGGEIALHADRGVYTNVYVGDVMLQNSVGLQGSHPFGLKESWLVGGSVDYQRSKSLFVIDTKESGLNIFHTAATLTWDWTRHRRLAFELSYTYQDSGPSTRMGMVQPAFTLHRAMAMATIEFVYPQPEEVQGRRRRQGRSGGGGSGGGSDGVQGGVMGGEGGVQTQGVPVRAGSKGGPSAPRGDGANP